MTGVYLGKRVSIRVSEEVDTKARVLAQQCGGLSGAYRKAIMMLYQQNSETHEKAQRILEQQPHLYKSVGHVYEVAVQELHKKIEGKQKKVVRNEK